MQIEKTTIILTGGAGSIGSFLARDFAGLKAQVVIIDKDKKALEEICNSEKNIEGYVCDLTDFSAVTKCIHEIFDQHPNSSVLINNAGLIYSAPLINLLSTTDQRHEVKKWNEVIDVNLNSVFNVGVNVIDKMVRNHIKGLIINVSSISAKGNPGQTAYAAAKAGVDALTHTWSKELFMLGIRVAGIAPGFFKTNSTIASLSENQLNTIIRKIPSQRLGHLEELGKGIKFIIETDYYNGKILELDGGLII
jgi:3-oxoacyl-[acyl-carrier protein] reductase